MSRARSGRKAAVYASYSSTPLQSAWLPMTWTVASKYAAVGSNFWLHSYDHQVEVRVNGVVSGLAITTDASTNVVNVAAGTVYITGSLTTVAADSVTSLAVATSAGKRIVYTLIYSTGGGVQAINTAQGSASTTRGSLGGPSFIPVGAICLGYVIRSASGASIITSAEITLSSFNGREWANAPGVDELRPLIGRAYFQTVPAQVHTGAVPPKIYWRGYSFNENFTKIGEIRNWSLGETVAAEDATTQNSHSVENDDGRITYSLSYEEFQADTLHTAFSHVINNRGDRIFKLYPLRTDTSNYWAIQGRSNVSMTFPLDNKATGSSTVTCTGRLEEFAA